MKRRDAWEARRDILFAGQPKDKVDAWLASLPAAFLDEELDDGANPLSPETRDGVLHLSLLAPIMDGLYGTVGPQNFVDALKGHEGDVFLTVNSPGGGVFAGWNIRNQLERHDGKVTALVDGQASSAAATVITGADERYMSRGSRIFLHNAWGLTIGDAEDHRKQAEVLTGMSADMAQAYADAGRGNAAHYQELMDAETWLTVSQAGKEGLAKPEPTALEDLFSGVVAESRNSVIVDRNVHPTANGGHMTEAEQAELDSVKERAEKAEARVKELEAVAKAEDQPEALFTSVVDGRVWTDKDNAEAAAVAKREHESKLEAMVSDYPDSMKAAARSMISAGDEDGLKSLDSAREIAATSTRTLSDPNSGEDQPAAFDAAVAKAIDAHGFSKSQAEVYVARTRPELV